MAFRGGTALQKLHLQPGSRYSEDIDLVQIRNEPIGAIINEIRKSLIWLGEPVRKITERSVKLTFKYLTNNNEPKKLKIEINTTEHYNYYDLVKSEFEVDSPWFKGKTNIVTYDINELIGTKLRALYQRRKGRDLFDLWIVIKHNMIDYDKVIEVFLSYCNQEGNIVTRALFEKNMIEKVRVPDFINDVESLLPISIKWSFDEASELVQNHIISKLPGEGYKIKGK